MISDLHYLLRTQWWPVLSMLALGVIVTFLLTAVDPIAMKLLIDEGLGQRNSRVFVMVIVCVFGLASLASGLNLIQGLWAQRIKNILVERCCAALFREYFSIPYQCVREDGSAKFLSRVYEEPRKAVELAVDLLKQVVSYVIAVITALGIALYLSWRVTLILAIIVPALYFVSRRFGSRIRSQSREESEQESLLRNRLNRGLEAYITVNGFDLEPCVSETLKGSFADFFGILYARIRSTWIFRTISGLSMAFAESAVMSIAAVDVFMGHMTVGGMLAFMAGFWKMMGGVNGLISSITDFSRVSSYVDRIRGFSEMAANSAVIAPEALGRSGEVHLDGIEFAYGESKVLRGVDFRIDAGERVVMIGANGAGKTTLALLLCGYLKATRQRGGGCLPARGQVSAMLSPLLFFMGCLREHLAWQQLSVGDRERAKKMLEAFGLIDKLDDDPSSFSEGQKRKSYVAMCLLRDADLYLLDEPLNAIDEGSKVVVMEWILKATQGRRLLVIMHGDVHFHAGFDRVERLTSRGLETQSIKSVA